MLDGPKRPIEIVDKAVVELNKHKITIKPNFSVNQTCNYYKQSPKKSLLLPSFDSNALNLSNWKTRLSIRYLILKTNFVLVICVFSKQVFKVYLLF